MATINTISNGDTGLTARTILNQIVSAVNTETVANLSVSGQTLVITHKDDSTTTLDLSGEFQALLESGTNIKSINGTSLLGSGDLEIEGTEVLDEDDYSSNSSELAPSQSSVKANDDILKGNASATGATLTFTKKDQTYNAGTPSSSATVTIDGTGAIGNSVAVFVSDGTEVTSIAAAGGETIRPTKGVQPTGEAGLLIVTYDGTSFWPSWRSEAGEGDVTSVNGVSAVSGDVTIDADDIDATATRTWAAVPSYGDGQSAGDPITFAKKEGGFIVGDASSPSSAASFAIESVGAVDGGWAKIYWNGSTAPSFTYETSTITINRIPSTAEVVVDEDNIILMRYNGSTIDMEISSPVKSADLIHELSTEPSTSYTLVIGDVGQYKRMNNASAITVTVPPNSSVAFDTGTEICFEQMGAGAVTISPGSGVTLNGTNKSTSNQYEIIVIKKVASDTWTVVGGTDT